MLRSRSRAVPVLTEPWRPALLASAAVVLAVLVLFDQASKVVPALTAYAAAWLVLGLERVR